MTDAAKSQAWPLVSFDMEWVTANWAQSGCDLWEEFTSDDFYWNRMAFVYSLNTAADFADAVGESSAASNYRGVANEIVESAKGHFNGDFIYSATVGRRTAPSSTLSSPSASSCTGQPPAK